MHYKDCLKGILFVSGLLAATVAGAHTPVPAGDTMLAGFLHPLSGWDHLLAMLAIGLWISRQAGTTRHYLPLMFAGVMMAGAILGHSGVLALPLLEAGIAGSLLLLGLLLVFAVRLPVLPALLMTGVFAAVHGYAHGFGMSQQASPVAFGLGFMLAAAALPALVAWLGRHLPGAATLTLLRAGGIATGTTGVLLLV